MKRRWLLLLGSLMLMLGIFVPHTAFAEEALPFEYKEPDESVKLFSYDSFEHDEDVYGTRSNFRFYDVEGDYTVRNLSPFKAIVYNKGTGLYTGNKSTVCDFGDGAYTSIDAEVYNNFDDAISNTVDNGIIHVPNNEDSYVLFFKPDAMSLSEVVYTCKWSEALSHVGESYFGIGNTMKVELVKAITNDDGSVNSGEFKVTYDLAEPCGILNIQGYDLIELKEGKSGSTTITLNYLTNSEYIFSLHDSDSGIELCSTVYKVDFVKEANGKTTNEKKKDVKRISAVIQSDKKKVEVPKTITDENGKKQKVTELGEKAFVKCSNVKQIVLHGNIVYVNKNAFSGISTKDKTIFLDASLTKKEVRKMEKKLRKAGFKGIIKQAEKNPGKKTADK